MSEELKEKSEPEGVERVYQSNPVIVIGPRGPYALKDFGGMSFSEIRELTCPQWWCQVFDYDKKPDWDDCLKHGLFSSCSRFSGKNWCWDKFDKENSLTIKK